MQNFHPNDINVQLLTVTTIYEVQKTRRWFYNPEKQAMHLSEQNASYPCYNLLYMVEGSYWHAHEDKPKRSVPTGSLSLFRVPSGNFLNTSDKLPMRYLLIKFHTWTEIPLDFTQGNIIVMPADGENMEAKFRRAMEVEEERSLGWQIRLKALTEEILLSFFTAYFANELDEETPPLIKESVDIIRREVFTEPLAVSDIAERCGVSTAYLIRVFNRHLGMTPKKYIDDLRYNRACDLLRNTDKSVEEIAALAGFPEPRHLRRVIRMKTGLTPREYRRGG